MARQKPTEEQRDPTEAEQPAADAPKRRGLFRRRAPAGEPAEGAAANGDGPPDDRAGRGKAARERDKRRDQKRRVKREGRGGNARLVVSVIVLFLLLGATLVTLDQVGKIKLPIKIPRFLVKAAPAGAGTESAAGAPGAGVPSAESEARRRLDLEEAPPAEAGGPSQPAEMPKAAAPEAQPAEGAATPTAQGEREQMTESEAALIEGLNVAPPTATGAGGVTDEQIKAAEKERLRKIGRVGIILSSMKPAVAAKTLEGMPENKQVLVIRSMEEDKIAKILSEMPPDKSAKLAQALMQ